MVVRQGQSGHLHVTAVRDLYGIGDCVADLYTLDRCRCLGDLQFCCRVFCLHRRAGCHCRRILTTDRGRGRCDDVNDLAGIYIRLRDLICIGDVAGILARFKLCAEVYRCPMVVRQGQFGHLHVTFVRDLHGIGDCVADLYIFGRCSCLGDLQLCCRVFCGYRRAGCHGRRIISAYRGCGRGDNVHDLASVYIRLRDCVVVYDVPGVRSGFQLCRKPSRCAVIIRQDQSRYLHVTAVRDLYGIGDCVADLHSALWCRCLGDLQFCCRVFGGHRRAGCHGRRIISAYRDCGRCYNVNDLARVYIRLRDCVRIGDRSCVCSGFQLCRKPSRCAMVVRQGQSGHLHVTAVRDLYGIGDCVADLYTLDRCRCLGDLQFCCRVFCLHRRAGCHGRRILSAYRGRCRGDNVNDLARVNVRLRDCVGIGNVSGIFASFKRCREACRCPMIVCQGQSGHLHVTAVCNLHGIGDLVAYLHTFSRCRGLGNLQLRFRVFGGYRRSSFIRNILVSRIFTSYCHGIVEAASIHIALLH